MVRGVVIHTIGFGEPGDVDEQFLAALADATGGLYTFARTPFELANQAVNTYHLSQGDPIVTFSGSLSEGKTPQKRPRWRASCSFWPSAASSPAW